MTDFWLSGDELMSVTGWKPDALLRRVLAGKIAFREKTGRHPNGKPVREYSPSLLPPKLRIEAERVAASRGQKKVASDSETPVGGAQLALFAGLPPKVKTIRVPVTEDHKAEVDRRLRMIEPLMELADQKFPARLSNGVRVRSWGDAVSWCAKQYGVSSKTITRIFTKFKRDGQGALLRIERKDKGDAGFFKTFPRASWLAAYLFLEERQSCRSAFEAILRDAANLDIPEDKLPCYETVRAWLSSMPPSLVVYAREGKKVYRERMAPYLKRSYVDVYANEVWVGDHAIFDVECANDSFDDAGWGEPIRVRISALVDYRSRLVAGVSFCWEGSSRSIAAAMRRGIQRYGLPEHLYVDNGRDYKKVAKGAMPGYLKHSPLVQEDWYRAELDAIGATGFLARMGIAVTHCIPHHPQSKHVERFFRTMHERFDKVWPTYTSGNPFTRPESTELAMMKHRRLLKAGRATESQHPRTSQFIAACLAWIEEYNDTPHRGEGMQGATPRQVFESNLNPNQRLAPEHSQLALLMAERESRVVRECALTLKNRRYIPTDQTGWAVMHQHNEREVVAVFDPLEMTNVAALDKDGNFLAWLEAEHLIKFAPYEKETQNQIAESMATRRRLEKGTRQAIEVISRAARANGAKTPLDSMIGRLNLPSGESGTDLVTQRSPRLKPEDEPRQRVDPGVAVDRMTTTLLRMREKETRTDEALKIEEAG